MRSFRVFRWCVCLTILNCMVVGAVEVPEKTPAQAVHIHLSGLLSESPMMESPLLTGSMSLSKLVRGLTKISRDPDVGALVLTYDAMAFGFAQLEEIRAALDEVREQGKTIYVHAEGMTTGVYALLCAGDYLSVAPASTLMLTGLSGESMYIKGLLDRLGIQADFLSMGDYKSAAETMTRTHPSAAAQENLDWLMDSLYDSLVGMMAQSRDRTPDQIKSLIDQGPFLAEQALEKDLIDAVETRAVFLKYVETELGGLVVFNNSYGRREQKPINVSSPFGLFSAISELFKAPLPSPKKDTIAVVYVEGPIVPGYGQTSFFGGLSGAFAGNIRKALETVAQDDSVKAVVMRVSSPGGSSEASEVILNAARAAQSKKPFVVSMGDTAASGGYYVACGADAIYADSATVTGSIGVVGGKLVTQGLWDKLGVNWVGYKRGAHADIFASTKPFDKEQRDVFTSHMETIYSTFKDHVVKGRGYRLRQDIDGIAGGRVYTGRQALGLGLVDYLGGLEQAIACAAKKASVSDYVVRVVPEPKDFVTQFMEELSGNTDRPSDVRLSLAGALLPAMEIPGGWFDLLQKAEPKRAKVLLQALGRIELLRTENVLMMLPYDFILE
ncbi:MAG: signal peptide peptidase SppA [Planctomycetes bacterium]|nr:signal peptide peptidase SppA [Planctomycetota bacterium]